MLPARRATQPPAGGIFPAMEDPTPNHPRRRRPLGLLALVAAASVLIGVVVVQIVSGGEETSPATASIPTLPVPGADGPQRGEEAPRFTITLMDGTVFDLAAHLTGDGRPVFLNAWASWCVPCRNEMPALEAASRRHPGVLFLGIAVDDDPTAAREFAAEVGVTYPLAVDESDTIGSAYLIPGLPTSILIDGEGTIVQRVFGEVDEDRLEELLGSAFGG